MRIPDPATQSASYVRDARGSGVTEADAAADPDRARAGVRDGADGLGPDGVGVSVGDCALLAGANWAGANRRCGLGAVRTASGLAPVRGRWIRTLLGFAWATVPGRRVRTAWALGWAMVRGGRIRVLWALAPGLGRWTPTGPGLGRLDVVGVAAGPVDVVGVGVGTGEPEAVGASPGTEGCGADSSGLGAALAGALVWAAAAGALASAARRACNRPCSRRARLWLRARSGRGCIGPWPRCRRVVAVQAVLLHELDEIAAIVRIGRVDAGQRVGELVRVIAVGHGLRVVPAGREQLARDRRCSR